jgi:hypothetical protein
MREFAFDWIPACAGMTDEDLIGATQNIAKLNKYPLIRIER